MERVVTEARVGVGGPCLLNQQFIAVVAVEPVSQFVQPRVQSRGHDPAVRVGESDIRGRVTNQISVAPRVPLYVESDRLTFLLLWPVRVALT